MAYQHEAMLFASRQTLLEAGLPWLLDGLDTGEVVALACDAENNAVLAAALDDPAVRVLPQKRIYHKAVDALAFYHDLITAVVAEGHPRVRVLGEVAFGTGAREREEWLRHESALNHVLAPCRCGACVPSTAQTYLSPCSTPPWPPTPGCAPPTGPPRTGVTWRPPACSMTAASRCPPPERQATFALTHVGHLRELRRWLRTRLGDLETNAEASDAVLLVVKEVAGNGLRHGLPPVRVTLWMTPTRILCDVTDGRPGITDPLASYTPPDRVRLAKHSVGLWITRRLCDEVSTGRSPTGFTVRLT